MANLFKNALRQTHKRSKKFSKNQDGATAIEFALVALPFFALLFAIIELAIIFFVNSALNNATSEAGRLIRVGQFQNCGGATRFRQLVCENMQGLGSCDANLRVDVVSNPTFSSISLPNTNNVTVNPVTGLFTPPAGTFTPVIAASSPVVVQSTFYYRLVLPAQLTRLETNSGTGIRILKSTTAFRTEPFPPSTFCPPPPPPPT